jgi:DNA-binding CsgD family transcriptional regulator
MVNNTRFREWWARFERVAASPAAAVALARMNSEIDVRPVLPAVRVPTLILHRRDDARISVEGGRYLAAHIEGARYVEAPGIDHPIFIGETDTLVDEIEEFLTGHRPSHAQDRMLATVLALELAEKTPRSGPSHDRAWCEAMLRCGRPVAEEIGRWRGRVLAMTADRGLAAFDGPARAVRCALALRRRLADFGLTLRAGLHLGELELRGDAASGAALDSAAHVARLAAPGEVLVSAAVRDLVSGSGLQFEPWTELHAGPFTLFCARDDLARHDLARGDLEAGIRRPPGRPAAGPPLSPREREVLALVARGLTNAEIALALKVSDHTAKRHVANILTKLDLPSRAAAAAYAARQSGEASNA